MEKFEKFMASIMYMIVSSIVKGFVIVKIWCWFIVPTFEAEPIRIVEAIGLVFLINYMIANQDKEEDKVSFWEKLMAKIVFLFLMAGFALLSGWIVQLFM